RYAVKNPHGFTPAQVCTFTDKVYDATYGKTRELDIDLHNDAFSRLVYEYLQIEFSLPLREIDRIFFDSAMPGVVMPHVPELIAHLYVCGIRTGVISNMGFSGETLKKRIDNLLPDNRFEFVIASSEYMYRKPHPMLFELALHKADLPAREVWFCGDSPNADIAGAAGVGIFPVWYEDLTMENPWKEKDAKEPAGEYLHIHDWNELIDIIYKLCHPEQSEGS
ncbi:MAG: HAD-IA family hydrolase, partial [Firmicutes bacterium]|nr:HAD-IA family hydrolase [Bacillota bacterium]